MTKISQEVSSLQTIQNYIKQLNDLPANLSSADPSSLMSQFVKSLEVHASHTQDIIDKLRKQQKNSQQIDIRTTLELIRPFQTTSEKKEKSELEKKEEWDMKKLYAEVFNMSYKRNRLRTQVEQDDLRPAKKGDDQPNFGNAIWWYSCDRANIYYQINSILRLENFELLMSYRYYLSDLCRMIEFMYQKRKDEQGDLAQTFYRAGNINKKQLEKMDKQQKGQFISLLGFISTTSDIEIAKGYAKKQHVSKDNERVLFEINIKPKEPCTAFAYINGISFHPKEEEVLFSMGSTFVVDSIIKPQNGDNFHTVKLIASEIDKTLVDDIRTKVENCSPSGRAVLLAQYLIELGEFRSARKYLNSLLIQADDDGILMNDPNLAAIYCCLGTTYARQGLHGDALKAFKQALNTQARLEYSNNNALANIHNNIGLAYVGLGHMDEAEQTLAKAVRIQLRELNSNQQHLASVYGNIGYVHYKKRDYDGAFDAFGEAEKIYKQSSSKIAHDALEQSLMKAEYLTNYGHLYSIRNSLTDAQERYKDALELYKSILPDGDPKLMQTHINIMLAYAQNDKYNEATKWFEDSTVQTLINKQEDNMFELNSSVTQASLAFLHEFIGACYAMQELFNKAIHLWKRSLIFKCKARLEQLLVAIANDISSTPTTEQKNLISKGYRLAREHFVKSLNLKNEVKDDQLSNDFCLGLLYAKTYSRDRSIIYLAKAASSLHESKNEMLLPTYLLLADMFKIRHEYGKAIENLNLALPLIKLLETQKDRVLEIEVQLTRIDCLSKIKQDKILQDNIVITELQKLGRSLKLNDTDTKRISLKVIVYDTLTRYCLIQKNYELFDEIAEESIALKLRNFSQYHPSLAVNFILIAQRQMDQCQYREALDFYEHALEVQNLNLTSNHPAIKKICYAIGDIYCKLDKLSNAIEKYDVAESKSLDVDEDNILQQDKINSEESMEIFMARISMHRHLAELHAKKQAFKEAISRMNQIINLLEEEVLPSIVEMNDETIFMQKNIDPSTFITSLEQLANCYVLLGDILGSEQNDENGYTAALDIYWKLFLYDEASGKDKLVLLYTKLSGHYEDLEKNDEALDYLQEAADLQEPTIATLYRLGHLNVVCEELDEAAKNYEKILSDQSVSQQKQLKQIVQEKLDEVQKEAKKSERRLSTSSSEPEKSRSASAESSSSKKLIRNPTNLSATSHQKSEVDPDTTADNKVDSTDYRAMAAAYIQLGDIDMSIKYYEKDIKKRSKNLSTPNIFQTQLEKIEQASYSYGQRNLLFVWPKIFHSFVKKIQGETTFEVSDITTLVDSFLQCALLYEQSSSYLKSIIDYISSFGLYASKALSDIEILITDMTKVLNSFVESDLKPKEILDICKRLLPSDDVNRIQLKIAAMYRDHEIDDVEDLDGDNDTSNESRMIALEYYTKLLKDTKDILIQGVCYYNVLSLYKNFIYEDESGKLILDGMITWSPEFTKFTKFDRRSLISLAIHFSKEYDTNADRCDKKMNQQLQKLAKDSIAEKVMENDQLCIGDYLRKTDDLVSAAEYWSEIVTQLECNISSRILSRVHDSSSTLDQILHTIKQPEEDPDLLVNQLASVYQTTGDYLMLNASNDQTKDGRSFLNAQSMYEKALGLLKRLHGNKEMITLVDQKQRKAASEAKKATTSSVESYL